MGITAAACAGTVVLQWSNSPSINVTGYSIFAFQGSNSTPAAGNTNAIYTMTVGLTNTVTFTNMPAGWWTFAAIDFDAYGDVSPNSTTVYCDIPLAPPSSLTVLSLHP